MFDLLFERSADAIWLLDPDNLVFVACNQAAVKLMRARSTAQLVGVRLEELSPPIQPNGQSRPWQNQCRYRHHPRHQ